MNMDKPAKSLSILVVDDESLMRQYLESMIPQLDPAFMVSGVAQDGLEAIRLLQQHRYDLVLTDVAMPEMDGLELARLIQQTYPDTIVVILSGYHEFDFAQKAVRYGVYDYLLKPLEDSDLQEVLYRVATHLERKKALSAQQVISLPNLASDIQIQPGNLIERAIAYILANYQEPISLSDVARHLDLSDSYLSDLFHKSTGEHYSKFLTKIRMEKAAELLQKYPDLKIYALSEKVGFLSTKHFITVFKKTFGLTPTEFQAQKIIKDNPTDS